MYKIKAKDILNERIAHVDLLFPSSILILDVWLLFITVLVNCYLHKPFPYETSQSGSYRYSVGTRVKSNGHVRIRIRQRLMLISQHVECMVQATEDQVVET